MFELDNVSILMPQLSEAKTVTIGFPFMMFSDNSCLVLVVLDRYFRCSILYRVSSPAQWSSRFINYTTGQLPVINVSVTLKAKCFPGKKFPQEKVYTLLAALESIRQDFYHKHAEEFLFACKTLNKSCTDSWGSISTLIMSISSEIGAN